MLTMLLGGLWHGAAWAFVVWGAIHGSALAVNRAIAESRGRSRRSDPNQPQKRQPIFAVLGWATTMLIVLISWVFFRAGTFEKAMIMLQQMFWTPSGISWWNPYALGLIGMCVMIYAGQMVGLGRQPLRADRFSTATILMTLLYLTIAFRPQNFEPFIYFQF